MFVSPGDTVLFATVYQSAGITETTGKRPLKHATVALCRMEARCWLDGRSIQLERNGPWNSSGCEQSLMKMVLDQPLELAQGEVALVVDASPTFEPIVVTEEVPDAPSGGASLRGLCRHGGRVGVCIPTTTESRSIWTTVPVRDDYMVMWNRRNQAARRARVVQRGGSGLSRPANGVQPAAIASCNGQRRGQRISRQFGVRGVGRRRQRVRKEQTLRFAWSARRRLWPTIFAAWKRITVRWATPFAEPASIQGNIPDGFGIFGVTNEVVNLED